LNIAVLDIEPSVVVYSVFNAYSLTFLVIFFNSYEDEFFMSIILYESSANALHCCTVLASFDV
jgi:hypothetical protein